MKSTRLKGNSPDQDPYQKNYDIMSRLANIKSAEFDSVPSVTARNTSKMSDNSHNSWHKVDINDYFNFIQTSPNNEMKSIVSKETDFAKPQNKPIQIEPEKPEKLQDPPVEHDLQFSLEQILHGCNKQVTIKRKLIKPDGSEVLEDKIVTIEVKPGTLSGTQFVFPQHGDQNVGTLPADVVFIVHDKPHSHFTRNGIDIEYTAQITQSQLDNNEKIIIPTIENNNILFSLRKVSRPEIPKRFPGRGLPRFDNPEIRGDLVVHFKIVDELKQDKAIERELPLSLENILTGCQKKIQINRKLFDQHENEIFENTTVSIDIKPGTIAGTKFTFAKMGDQNEGSIPADVIFVTTDKEHETFKRVDLTNLEYIAKITQSEAKGGDCKIYIPTLEQEWLPLRIDKPVDATPNRVARISGRGLPFVDEADKRGDLLVKFEIVSDDLKDPPIFHELPLTLLEILNGCSKQIKIDHTANHENSKTIKILPGTPTGTNYIFHRQGPKNLDKIPADVIYTTTDVAHPVFKRKGADIEYTAQIAFSETTSEMEIEVPTLINEKLTVLFEKGKAKKKFPGYGLPYHDNPNKRGFLICKFEIVGDDLKDPAIEKELPLTLNEILTGCSKQVQINQTIIDENGIEQSQTKHLTIEVKPGTEFGTRYVFPRKGNQKPGRIPADVVCISKEIPHDKFKRNGFDLLLSVQVNESEIQDGKLKIFTLEDDLVSLELGKEIPTNGTYRIQNRGLPLADNPNQRGDLVVKLEVASNPVKSTHKLTRSFSKSTSPRIIAEHLKNPLVYKDCAAMKFDLPLTLEQIFNGTTETVQFTRNITDLNGQTFVETKKIDIQIKPGIECGHEFIFRREGHQAPLKAPVDVIFVVKTVPHPLFKRNGSDIEYTANITPKQAQIGSSIQIPTLENKLLSFKISSPIKSGYVIPFPGYGLPVPENSRQRGRLWVHIEIDENEKLSEQISKLAPNQYDLPLSLHEILHGCVKEANISVKITKSDGNTSWISKTFPIQIKPGLKTGSTFHFPESGDQAPNSLPADVIFTTIDEPNNIFERNGADLHQTIKITAKQANSGSIRLRVATLENGQIPVYIDKRIIHGSTMELSGYGLPFENDEHRKGNLVIHFEIVNS